MFNLVLNVVHKCFPLKNYDTLNGQRRVSLQRVFEMRCPDLKQKILWTLNPTLTRLN